MVDIQEWANWTVDYMKDDSCGSCRSSGPHGGNVADYAAMQTAIQSVGRPIVLTIEGGPDITVVCVRDTLVCLETRRRRRA
jgi:hypothetical protein